MSTASKTASAIRIMIKIFLPVCLILAGIAGFRYYKSQQVKMTRKAPEKHAVAVETLTVSPGTHNTLIHAMGTVSAERQVVLKTQVAGQVVWVSPKFVEGGIMHKGEILVRLEDDDYRLALDKAKSSLDKALADFEIEKGQQLIAREELRLIAQVSPEGVTDTALALRKPQLEQARAAVAGATSDYETAGLDLKRTRIVVPFDALIVEKNVDFGSTASVQAVLATLVNVDQYRVEVQVPLDRLGLLNIHKTSGSPAKIRSLYADRQWEGRVVRTTGQVTGQSRMAGVIVVVRDPLGLNTKASGPGLFLNDHVEAIISGRSLDNVFSLPRSLVRENNTLWIYDDGRLDIRQADFIWKEKERIFVRSGLISGDRVVRSDIPVPVQGMALDLAEGDKS